MAHEFNPEDLNTSLEHEVLHPHLHTEHEVEAAAALTLTPRKPKYSKEQHCYKKTALNESEKEQFYNLMMPLRFYVSQKLKMEFSSGSEVSTIQDYKDKLTMAEKFLVRDAVYDHLHLITEFLHENPPNFSKEQLSVIESWRNHHYRGTFIVERHLQKGTIFITQEKDEEEKVFLVHGLETPLVEMLPKHILPLVIKTVLLPFKGKIIYDGLFKEAPTLIGSQYTRSLKEAYMRAKQQDSIIVVLTPEEIDDGKRKHKKRKKEEEEEIDVKKLAFDISAQSAQLKKAAPKGIESSVCSVLCMTAQLVTKVLENPKDRNSLTKNVRSLTTALNRL